MIREAATTERGPPIVGQVRGVPLLACPAVLVMVNNRAGSTATTERGPPSVPSAPAQIVFQPPRRVIDAVVIARIPEVAFFNCPAGEKFRVWRWLDKANWLIMLEAE